MKKEKIKLLSEQHNFIHVIFYIQLYNIAGK